MGHIVVVAEKPSVGRDIARVLGCRERGEGCLRGEKYIVTWAVGHLVTLMEPDEIDEKYKRWSFETLPILPEKIPLKIIRQTKAQFQILKQLMNDSETDSLICATDAGREGELIFRYIYEKAGCRKPFARLWISSMTDEAISDGFRSIRPSQDYDGLYASAKCRSKADWLVGMNASRAFSLKYNTLLSVGRVQTPTLAILVKRRKEIENFIPDNYVTLQADFGDYTGTCFSGLWEPETHIPTRDTAEEIAAAIRGKTARIIEAETSRRHEAPPQLYDLTSLQRDANKMLGFTAERTLKIAQSLYEKHKALTYPRTDSRYLPPDMIPRVVQTMKVLPPAYQAFVPGALPDGRLPVTKRTVDASKVTDHHAIIPTNKRVDPVQFSEDERRVYDMVARRLLAAFYPSCDYDATKVITQAEQYLFRTNGKTIIQNGWHDVPPTAEAPKSRKRKSEEEEDAVQLPPLKEGDERAVKGTKIKEDKTKPPAPHTDASLLLAMETAGKELDDEEMVRQMKGRGIGTPATRAAIIERLLHVGYAQRKGKTLTATDKGVSLIEIMPNEIASPELTGRWELALHEITDGKQNPDRFLEGINRMCSFLVQYVRDNQNKVTFPDEERKKRSSGSTRAGYKEKILDGTLCPLCGKGKMKESSRAFSCTEKECKCTFWKDMLIRGGGPELNEKIMRIILEKRQVTGSTGTIQLQEGRMRFYPKGSEKATVNRTVIYEQK